MLTQPLVKGFLTAIAVQAVSDSLWETSHSISCKLATLGQKAKKAPKQQQAVSRVQFECDGVFSTTQRADKRGLNSSERAQ
jgi:hypothetical protein